MGVDLFIEGIPYGQRKPRGDIEAPDRYANYNLALLLAKYHPEMKAAIKMHLRRSFTDGDSNYAAQFWYARFLYVDDLFGEAKKYFSALAQARLNPEIKDAFRGLITDAGKPMIFQGVVSKKEHSFGFIRRDGYQDMVFVHRNDVDERVWEDLREGNRVEFEMGFSYRGPKARYVRKEAVVRGK